MTALRIPQKVKIPEPAVPLGPEGRAKYDAAILSFDNWEDHELAQLNLACVHFQTARDLTEEIAAERDAKWKRKLRADRRAESNEYRKLMRELSLSARPNDARPPRIAGRY